MSHKFKTPPTPVKVEGVWSKIIVTVLLVGTLTVFTVGVSHFFLLSSINGITKELRQEP